MFSDHNTKTITIGGFLTIFLANIASPDLLKTVALAAVGAVVSFLISQILKFAMNRFGQRKHGNKE